MIFRHADLVEFFANDSSEDPVEADGKLLFSESHFEVHQGDWTLHISFSTQAPVVMADLHHANRPDPVTTVEVQRASGLRMHTNGGTLDVLSDEADACAGVGPTRVILSITKDPLTLSVYA